MAQACKKGNTWQILLTYYSDPFDPATKPVATVRAITEVSNVAYFKAQVKRSDPNTMSVIILDTTELGADSMNWDIRVPNTALSYDFTLFSGSTPTLAVASYCKIPSSAAGDTGGFATSEVT